MNIFSKLKKNRLVLVTILVITIPLFVWALANLRFNLNKKAEELTRVAVSINDSPYIGPISAPVTLVEFTDFECPYCKMFHEQTLQQLLSMYPNKIRFVFKHYPLTQNESHNAELAAETSMCASDQSKFWQMSDLLFANQGDLTVESIKDLASQLDLDQPEFNNCMDTNKYYDFVQSDKNQGNILNIYGTPTFFINGIRVDGAAPLATFTNIIDSELATPEITPSPSPSVTNSPVVYEDDDIYFKDKVNISFQSVGKSPNVSVSPTEIVLGSTYIVNVDFDLQNKAKGSVSLNEAPVYLRVNNFSLGFSNVNIPLIASHRDGAGFMVSGVFTATEQITNLSLLFDPENIYKETDENNNKLSFDFATKGEPNSCNGTCGSNYNCQSGYFCYQGFCRNPSCPSDKSCGCTTITTTPSPSPNVITYEEVILYPSASPDPRFDGFITLKDPNAALPTYRPVEAGVSTVSSDSQETDYMSIVIMSLAGAIALWAFIVLIKSFNK